MRKGYRIDPVKRTIEHVEFDGLKGLQDLVGGYIECAYQWDSGDALFVDEEGLLKGGQSFFRLVNRMDQAFAGRGVLVGREVEGPQYPMGYINLPPQMNLRQLQALVLFVGEIP